MIMQEPEYQTRFDAPGIILEFLRNLRPEDIITELIQNDLDADASSTKIRFDPDRIICEGNGVPIDRQGWKRLTYVLGAGTEVEAKHDGIGIKNHGLRACFWLANDIVVKSDKKRIKLTLHARASNAGLYPGAWERPVLDENAPSQGCQIEILYRDEDITLTGNDIFRLPAVTERRVEEIFQSASKEIPQRLIGVLRPRVCPSYELQLIHWKLGTCHFRFSTRNRAVNSRLILYRRTCTVKSTDGDDCQILSEDAHAFRLQGVAVAGTHVPRFYRARGGIIGEVSWQVDAKGRPLISPGRYRYPIGYPKGYGTAQTGFGFNLSAPFISSTARHGLADGFQATNSRMIERCERKVIEVLREYLVPRYGPSSLNLLKDPDEHDIATTKRLVHMAAEFGALPRADKRYGRRNKGRQSTKTVKWSYRCVPVGRTEKRRKFVIPCFTWQKRRISPLLAKLCPPNERQLHPKTPEFIVEILAAAAANDTGHPHSYYTTFDENDVMTRLQPGKDGFFPWDSEESWNKELSNTDRVQLYLSVIAKAAEVNELDDGKVKELRSMGKLPTVKGYLRSWHELLRATTDAPIIPGAEPPPILDIRISNIPLLRRGRLALKPFNLDDYVRNLQIESADFETRVAFFRWLRRNHSAPKGSTIKSFASLSIWPTTEGELCTLNELCYPSKRIREIMCECIKVPTTSVLNFPKLRRDGRGLLRLRSYPSKQELKQWYFSQITLLEPNAPLTQKQMDYLADIERTIAVLLSIKTLRDRMGWLKQEHMTVNGRGELSSIEDLHLNTQHVNVCELRPEDLLAGSEHALYRSLGALTRPSGEAIARALQKDAANTKLLYRRLAAYLKIKDSTSEGRLEIEHICFVPVNGKFYPPSAIALKNPRDYWGDWKVALDDSALSTEQVDNLRKVGVINREPQKDTSVKFFEWLSEKPEKAIQEHLDQVIRQFLHKYGPLTWWHERPNLPCLPVRISNGHIKLVSMNHVTHSSSPVVLPDFPMLEKQILQRDVRRQIAIVETRQVTDSILTRLRNVGVRSLQGLAGSPDRVFPSGDSRFDSDLNQQLVNLKSRKLRREMRKRLQELGAQSHQLKTKWQHSLEKIQEVRIANFVSAEFRLGRYRYRLDRHSAVDPLTGILWISADVSDLIRAFYEGIKELIFSPEAPITSADALRRAVEMDFQTRITFKAASGGNKDELSQQETGEIEDYEDEPNGKDRSPVHKPLWDDAAHNIPSPGSLLTNREIRKLNKEGGEVEEDKRAKRLEKSRQISRSLRDDSIEKEEILKLKKDHYAWHCQACLGESTPSRLSPKGSYSFYPQHRTKFLEAHHIYPVSLDGKKGAENILILCYRHHHQFGDKISSSMIREHLCEQTKERTIHFSTGTTDLPEAIIGGVSIDIEIDVEPWIVTLFFTKEHATIWRGATDN